MAAKTAHEDEPEAWVSPVHARELDVGAIREDGVALDTRAESAQLGYVKFLARHDAVRVADAQRHDLEDRAVDVQRRQVRAEGGWSHVRGDVVAVDDDRYSAAWGVDDEFGRSRTASGDQPAGEDAHAVATLFGVRTVRVDDPQPELAWLEQQETIRADAVVAVAQQVHPRGADLEGQVSRVSDEVVVAEAVALGQHGASARRRVSSDCSA